MDTNNDQHLPINNKISRRPKFSWLISIIIVVGLAVAGYFILFSKAATTTEMSATNALYGTWVLQQVSSVSELNNYKTQIYSALDTKGTTGFSVRFPWKNADLSGSESSNSLLDAARKLVDDYNAAHPGANKQLAIRFMAGRHVPARVFDAGAKYYLKGSEKVGTPWGSTSPSTYTPNSVWVAEYDKYVGKLAAWSKANNVHLLHLSWWAQDWAELNHGAEVRAVAGYSVNSWLAGHKELIDVGAKYADDSLTVEVPLSGYGPLSNGPSASLADYIIGKVGPNSSKFYIQANGWAEDKEWGAPDPTTENQFRQIWDKPIKRGLQMIQPYGYDWAAVYKRPVAVGATYTEVYLPSFSQTSAQNNSQAKIDALKVEVGKFCGTCNSTTPDTTSPTVTITQPSDNAVVSGTVNISASASDNAGGSGLDKIELYIDNKIASSSTTSILNYSWSTNALPDGNHIILVKAYDKSNNISSASRTVSINSNDTSVPKAPESLTATAVNAGEINLAWKPATDNKTVLSYEINRDNKVIATGISTTTYVDTGVSPNTSYTYSVIAVDAAGNKSSASALATAKTPGETTTGAPKVPTGLTATPGNRKIKLKWNANTESDIKQYGIRYRKVGNQYWTFLAVSKKLELDVTKLPPHNYPPFNGTTYEFSIRARNEKDQISAWSDSEGHSATAKPIPNTPGKIAVKVSESSSSVNASINWAASADTQSGDAYRLTIGDSSYTTSSTNYNVSGLKRCTTYSATVKNIDSAGISSSSTTTTFTTPGRKLWFWCI